MTDARNLAIRISETLKNRGGIGPGFLLHVRALPSEWQALLDAIPAPEKLPAETIVTE